jgi:protein TonB
MFSNLIESDSHRKEFKRRSSFFLATVAAYALILSAAGVASIYAYDAHLEAQNTELVVGMWVPPVKPVTERERPQPARRAPVSNNTGRVSGQPVRPILYESASNPTKAPDKISGDRNPIPPAPPNTRLGNFVGDPVSPPGNSTCVTCTASGTGPAVVKVDDATPPPNPPVVKPPTMTRLPSSVLLSKVISLPQPPYPILAKQIKALGAVNVQILVDEQGRVVSAQAVTGNPMLLAAAKDAALRARFTPTILSGVAVKVQGVITYNFVLH